MELAVKILIAVAFLIAIIMWLVLRRRIVQDPFVSSKIPPPETKPKDPTWSDQFLIQSPQLQKYDADREDRADKFFVNQALQEHDEDRAEKILQKAEEAPRKKWKHPIKRNVYSSSGSDGGSCSSSD